MNGNEKSSPWGNSFPSIWRDLFGFGLHALGADFHLFPVGLFCLKIYLEFPSGRYIGMAPGITGGRPSSAYLAYSAHIHEALIPQLETSKVSGYGFRVFGFDLLQVSYYHKK